MSRALVAAFLAAATQQLARAQSATLLWQQSEEQAIYTSASISRHAGKPPTFATATWLNNPIYVEVYNVSDSGENVWAFGDAVDNATTFTVRMARHTERDLGTLVDTVAVEGTKDTVSDCVVRAWDSLGNAVPVWSLSVPDCANGGIDISDDGSTVSFTAGINVGGANQPHLWVLDAQTGALRFNLSLAVGAAGGGAQLSETGAWVAWTQGDSVVVLNGTSGLQRGGLIEMGWNTEGHLSDDGGALVFSGQDTASIYAWDVASDTYSLAYTVVPPGDSAAWYSTSCAVSSDSAQGVLAAFGWIGPGALQARVTIYSVASGALLTDYTTPKNAALQTNPSLRADGAFVGLALWGDNDDVPTAVVLRAGSDVPAFTFVTPGSMFGVDIVLASTNNSCYFSVAGKHNPANIMGKGGDAYTWLVTA